ncbi:MAG TPA: alpha-2-macroglobulin family protein, partial [Pseudomonadales bacterium]|nr:alpha-2-macroglobulin family protein [Pseudomonadales bacterium]
KVEAPDTVIPGSTIDFKVSTSEPARVALYAVDEGILQVAGYKNPDPLAFFFQKRALEVDTLQILDLILPEFSQLMNAAAPGGDGEKALEGRVNPFKRKRQQPAVYWSGLVDVPAGGKTFSYTTPDSFNGKLRIIAVAVTPERVGVFAGATEVRGPIILTPNIPAFIAPHDEVLITTGVFNNLPTPASITVELKTSAGLQTVGENLSSVTLDVAPQKEGTATFTLQGTEALGSADLYFTASTDNTTVKLHDTTSVRPAVPYRTQLTVGRSDKSSTEIPTTRDLFDPFRQVEFGAGFSPIVWMRGMENYLEHYMYGCTEQLVSKALPALVFTPHDVLVAGKSPAIDTAISIMMQRQNSQGGFGLWSANPVVSPIVSSYATDFLMEAKERGYPVPRAVLERASAYLEYFANQPSDGLEEMRARAYATYLLTRSGKLTTRTLADITTQLNTYHSKEWKTDIIAAYIAASYALLKQDDMAQTLIADVPWRELGKEKGYYSVYYDALVHDTTLLTLISRHFPAQTKKVPAALLDQFGERISRNEYHSLSAANMIRAMDLYDAQVAANGDIKVRAKLKDQQNVLLEMLSKPPRAELPQGTVAVDLEKVNGAHAYYLMSESGFDRTVPATELKQGIEVISEYQDLEGKP